MSETWPPEPDKNRCSNCGEHVTKQFIRVFGRNGCTECLTYRELHGGSDE